MTNTEFRKLVDGHRMAERTSTALRLVLVEKKTWRVAAQRAGVAESTILRAMRRLSEPRRPRRLTQLVADSASA